MERIAGPNLRCVQLSLFVADLAAARERYRQLLGCEGVDCRTSEARHPFAGAGPIIFELANLRLALYEAQGARGTHPGDLGVGLAGDEAPVLIDRAQHAGFDVVEGGGCVPALLVSPEPHFFEIIAAPKSSP